MKGEEPIESGMRNPECPCPLLLIALGVVLAISGTGCTAGQPGGAPRGTDTTLYALSDQIRFTNADLNKGITLRRNQSLLVVLKSDPEVYGRWTVKSTNPQVMALVTTRVRGENALDDCWLFTARGVGNSSLRMVYTPYDDTLPPREHTSHVLVRNIE